MALDPNNELLKQTLEAADMVDGRYRDLHLVNVNAMGEKRGCFSMVFRAYDVLDEKLVALKFYDLAPDRALDDYRKAAFRREHEILQSLQSVERCLQLASSLRTYDLVNEVAGVKGVTLPCQYFAVEWLSDEIDEYFLAPHKFGTIEKLKLFNEILLAVEALHAHEVFHRDLKADNLRAYNKALKKLVVAIDLGTAARYDSGQIQPAYGSSVGARGYASPEAICGLAGNRVIAPFNDYYALGCLLYELFNPGYFYDTVRMANSKLDLRLRAMQQLVTERMNSDKQVDQWICALDKFSRGVTPVVMNGVGSDLPPGIAPLLNELLAALTCMDFRNRKFRSDWARRKIQSAIILMKNESLYKQRLSRAREIRTRKLKVAEAKLKRIKLFIKERESSVYSQATR